MFYTCMCFANFLPHLAKNQKTVKKNPSMNMVGNFVTKCSYICNFFLI